MSKLLISFEKRNVRLGTGQWLFQRAWPMRFEWIALLAYKRQTSPGDQTWVELAEVSRLPTWGGKGAHDTSTCVGRYLQSAELQSHRFVEAGTMWSGPFRLGKDVLSVEFDLPLSEVRARLQLRSEPASRAKRESLLSFTFRFARAQRLIFQGRLERKAEEKRERMNAYELLMRMASDRSYVPTMQLLAVISATDVLFRLGRYRAARQTLSEHRHTLAKVSDASLKARYYLKVAWAHQRTSSGIRSDRAVEAALQKASYLAQSSGDRATLGLLAHRTAGYRTKKGRHEDALNQLVIALEANLITGNYDNLQAACGEIGSITHRLGPKLYDEARAWLLVSIAIAKMMKIGRDDAHAEMILGKIYAELKNRFRSRWFLERAERIASQAGNRVNLGDVRMVWGFWYERFGTRQQLIDTLTNAVRTFRGLSEFDVRQKMKYMERAFPIVWPEVAAEFESDTR